MNDDNNTMNHYSELASSVKALKQAIIQAQSAVASDANRVMLRLYIGIGCFVSQKTRNGAWGTGAMEAISQQLQREMPGLRGFGWRNIWNMRLFYEQWSSFLILQPAAAKLPDSFSCEASSTPRERNLPMSLADSSVIHIDWFIRTSTEVNLNPEEFFAISFSHHIEILNKAKTLEERLFYIHSTVINRWNKLTLRRQLAADIYHHAGTMPSNFQNTIPNTQLAVKTLGMFRDEYLLDFINCAMPSQISRN